MRKLDGTVMRGQATMAFSRTQYSRMSLHAVEQSCSNLGLSRRIGHLYAISRGARVGPDTVGSAAAQFTHASPPVAREDNT